MAGVMNNTARQFNLRNMGENKHRVTVRLAPGFNVVKDEHWLSFVSKDGKKVNPYVKELKEKGFIDFGTKQNDREIEDAPDTVSKSKSVRPIAPPNIPNQAANSIASSEHASKILADAHAVAAKIKADAETKAEEVKTKAKTEAETEVKVDVKVDAKAKTGAEAKTEVDKDDDEL